jgi:hypothetical protein
MIADYLDSLSQALSFDRALSQRVREEIEDHLREAAAADPAEDRPAAEARAIARCGDPRSLAAEFALVALAKRSRRLGVGIVVLTAAVLAAMELRSAWYTAMQWVIGDEMRRIAALVGAADRYAFLIAMATALGALIYVSGRGIPTVFRVQHRNYFRRVRLLCVAATASLTVSIATDAALLSIRMAATDPSAAFFIPILLVAFEIACAGALVAMIRDLAQRTTSAAALARG